MKGAGNVTGALEWYDGLTNMFKEKIRETSFKPFILALPTVVGRHDLNGLYALMERWMDSTHTFHLPVGELTLDLVASAVITGVACAGEPVPFNRCLVPMTLNRAAYIEQMLGIVPTIKATHTVKFDSIITHYSTIAIEVTFPREIDQVVRAFIFYLLGPTLFCDAASSVDLVLLTAFRDVDLISTYDWGSAALAYLY